MKKIIERILDFSVILNKENILFCTPLPEK